jgi:hypothetical protein
MEIGQFSLQVMVQLLNIQAALIPLVVCFIYLLIFFLFSPLLKKLINKSYQKPARGHQESPIQAHATTHCPAALDKMCGTFSMDCLNTLLI